VLQADNPAITKTNRHNVNTFWFIEIPFTYSRGDTLWQTMRNTLIC